MAQNEKIDELVKDTKTLLKKVADLDKSLEVFKVRSEKIPSRLSKVEKDLDVMSKERQEIFGFIKYAKLISSLIIAALAYFGIKIEK